jgi:hypothetical protein
LSQKRPCPVLRLRQPSLLLRGCVQFRFEPFEDRREGWVVGNQHRHLQQGGLYSRSIVWTDGALLRLRIACR